MRAFPTAFMRLSIGIRWAALQKDVPSSQAFFTAVANAYGKDTQHSVPTMERARGTRPGMVIKAYHEAIIPVIRGD